MDIKQEHIKQEHPSAVKREDALIKSAFRSKSGAKRTQSKVRFVDHVKEEDPVVKISESRVKAEITEMVTKAEPASLKKESSLLKLTTPKTTKIEQQRESSTQVDSVQEITAAEFVKTEKTPKRVKVEGSVKNESSTKSLLGKRTHKERAKKFLELEAEESDTEVIREITESA